MTTVGYHTDDAEQMTIIRGLAELLQPWEVLEIGCGHQRFKALFQRYVGVDRDEQMTPDFVMSADALDFEDQSFDMVLSVTVLMHNKEISKILEEMARVARRYIVLIEAFRWIGGARPHSYTFDRFDKVLELKLTTYDSPLCLWVFKRR